MTGEISEANYTFDVPDQRNKSPIYHVTLIKPYYRRPKLVNLLIVEEYEAIEEEVVIPYPIADPNQIEIWELVKESEM